MQSHAYYQKQIFYCHLMISLYFRAIRPDGPGADDYFDLGSWRDGFRFIGAISTRYYIYTLYALQVGLIPPRAILYKIVVARGLFDVNSYYWIIIISDAPPRHCARNIFARPARPSFPWLLKRA